MAIKKFVGLVIATLYLVLMFQIPFLELSSVPSYLIMTEADFANFSMRNISLKYKGDGEAIAASTAEKENRVGRLSFDFFNLFPIKSVNVKVVPDRKVFIGGYPVGLAINSNGVIVVGLGQVNTEYGMVDIANKSGIMLGDIITKIGDRDIINAESLVGVLNEIKEKSVVLDVNRNNKMIKVKINPVIDSATNLVRLGLWVRDNIAGIGTVTYVRLDGRFGSLGHNISSSETNTQVPCYNGNIYECKIWGVNKGSVGKTGELRGMFANTKNPIGTIDKNIKYGVYGNLNKQDNDAKLYDVGSRLNVKNGKAQILTTIGSQKELFDIEIVKAETQTTPNDKSMVVKVTDKRLIDRTGGIVQGMSGSPIIQNNVIIGSLTHVFVNDPTRGYGLYLDFMYEN